MTTINNQLNKFAVVQRRHRELLERQPQSQATALPENPLAVQESWDEPVAEVPQPSPRALVESPDGVPPTLADPALYGVAGRALRGLAPHSEADPVAVLLQFLAAFGNLAGPKPHSLVGPTRHGLNLRDPRRRIEQGPQRNKLAPGCRPLR